MMRNTRRYGQDGATMVEAAIASLVVMMLLFGVFQAAMVARTYISAQDSAAAGARVGAISGNNAEHKASWQRQ